MAGLILATSLSTAGADMTGRDVVARLDGLGPVRDLSSEMEMRIYNRNGQERLQKLSVTTKRGADGARMTLMRFILPADVKGTCYLNITRPGAPDESWLYLPALGKPRRIAGEERSSSFMGSDFTYADIGLLKVDDYRHDLLRREKLDGEETFVVESIPLTDEIRRADGFARKTWWIRRESFTVAKAEFRDAAGKLLKILRGSEVKELAAGAWLDTRLEMQNLETGSKTVAVFGSIRINTGVADDYFTVRQLTRPGK